MYGENRHLLLTISCVTCGRWVALRVDVEDLARHEQGMLVQCAFAHRDGKPYLSPGSREMLISRVCSACWPLLCPDDPSAYS